MTKRKATGDLTTFAKRNRLSKSALAEVIAEMKELGFPIKYDRKTNTESKEDQLLKLCGAWQSEKSAEEIIDNIYSSRTSGEK
jgi:hypothetical protein